jgi:hypothetical protein
MNFQHVHNIRGARNTNAKCMYDILKTRCLEKSLEDKSLEDKSLEGLEETVCKALEVLPAIITSYNTEDASKSSVVVSLVILATDSKEEKILLDPAYDVFSLENKRYYLNIKEFVEAVAETDQNRDKLKTLAMDFLLLMETAKQIGDGSFDQYNRELYEKQMEYVNLKIRLTE